MVGVLRKAQASNCRVLLIDTDSQAHAILITTSRQDYDADNSLYTVLMADRTNAANALVASIVPSEWDPDLHILPASPILEGAERELMGVAGAPWCVPTLCNHAGFCPKQSTLPSTTTG
jgi:chromosome partitioning protein